MIFLAAILGGLFNRIRGGWLLKRYHDLTNSLAFGFFAGVVLGSWEAGVMAALGMGLGASLGWGRYIGALGGWETRPLEEVAPIDWAIRGWRPKLEGGIYRPSWKLYTWGASGLALRGALWGAALVLPVLFCAVANEYHLAKLSIFTWILWAGVTMPVAYMVGKVTAKLSAPYGDPNWRGKMWELGEVFYGLALWGGWYHWFGA